MPEAIVAWRCAQSCRRRVVDLLPTALSRQDLPIPAGNEASSPRHARPHISVQYSFAGRCFTVLLVALAMSGMIAASARAQEESKEKSAKKPEQTISATRNAFRLYRWQEDYSYLATKQRSGWETLKYIPLPGLPGSWLSLGGEARYRLDAYDPYLFGLGKSGRTWASNQERLLQHFDLHLGQMFRTFVQFDTAHENGRPVQRAYDQSAPDLRQGFLDFILPTRSGSIVVRSGRQELYLGDSRWLAVRDPTNLRRSFDGFLAQYDDPKLTVRAFSAHPVGILPGFIDDYTLTKEYFRGGYANVRNPFGLPLTIDAYVYGRQQASATYARGTAAEDRWTGGARLSGRMGGFEGIAEAAYQWGSFGTATISARGAFCDLGYRFAPSNAFAIGVQPKLGVRGHYASGDDNLKSGIFHNFTAAYPAASVISEMSLLSVSNAVNLQPYAQLFIDRSLVLGANWNVVRKVATADSVYGPIGTMITAKSSAALGLAQIGQVDMTWNISQFLQLHALYSHIFAGQYIRDAGGRSFDYYRLQLMARW
ncbi:MAG: alginate export family protein [Bradyrhizobium sp.]|uniref:alginate export family protein n=1 Tax=Bradyrhizobium sp. TaxID=376 RepID=UPI0025C2F98C|nr:alginate export family protein [Bradyrhizobium sp.]MBI5262105.1 alginate export family protein [Bradyrhizobium sp.]